MGTVLVLADRSDITADAVVDLLTRRRARVVRYDTADFPVSSKVLAAHGSQGWQGTLSGHHRIELESIRSVWWRRRCEFGVPRDWSDDARASAASEGRVGVLGALGSLPARWINHPSRASAANYRPAQLTVAARAGLEVPRTVIASDLEHAREFIGSDEVVCKGLSGGVLTPDRRHRYIPSTLVRANDLDEALAGTAHLFQERVPRAFGVRLTVIGSRMFPVAIHAGTEAGKLGWRTDYATLTYRRLEVPVDVQKGVRLLMDELGLFFGALDFAVTPDGRWVFFEVNPNGQWHWLAVKAGVPMVEAMADALQREDQ